MNKYIMIKYPENLKIQLKILCAFFFFEGTTFSIISSSPLKKKVMYVNKVTPCNEWNDS